jgi:hypothetical protein
MIKKIIAIFPGRFQPMGKHHAAAFAWLSNMFDDAYVATSNKVDPPKSPLNFDEKKQVADKYGVGDRMIQVKNPYKAEEITSKYDPETTAVVFMVGQKDMQEDPRFSIGKLKSGKDSYFQKYEPKKPLAPYTEHGYLIVAPHIKQSIEGAEEMSGTAIRHALSSKEPNKQQFTDIFGWYDPKVEKMLRSKFSEKNESLAIFEGIIKRVLLEGGAAGHMAHPFDIPSVKTGKDLVSVFEKTATFLTKNEVPVKIDGINASIRYADIDGKRQFALDRGSNKPLDVKGITSSDLLDRFGEGHGMIKIGGKVIEIFNKAIPSIKPELKALGMEDNPNVMLNIEYVEGQSNVQKYEKNFLAIHNLLEIEQVTPKRRGTKEIPYDKKALQSLIEKVDKVAKDFGFEVVGMIPAKLKSKPNFSSVLSESYEINLDGTKKVKESLATMLSKAKNTKGDKLKLKDGKTIDALSKQVFIWIKDGKPVSELVADPNDSQLAVDSFVIYMATMQLGDAILQSLTSPIGDVKEQEGIVVRDPKVYSAPYKITGSFIVRGMSSAFQSAQ